MGGSIRKDMGSKVTHLISNACGGSKYQYAITFRVPVMSREWVFRCWEQRLNLNFTATSNDFIVSIFLKHFCILFKDYFDPRSDYDHAKNDFTFIY